MHINIPKIEEIQLRIDFHCHVMPGMDDGSKDVQTSKKMLLMLQQQGVARVIATPHYYRHKESISSFLERRSISYEQLSDVIPQGMEIIQAAEVSLEYGLSVETAIRLLSIGSTNYILLEFPYSSFKSWMTEEVVNIAYKYNVIPILAHVDRYLEWYTSDQMEEITHIPGTVLQVNCEGLENRKSLHFILSLIKQGHSLVFGTDSHNLTSRVPNMNLTDNILKRKLTRLVWNRLWEDHFLLFGG